MIEVIIQNNIQRFYAECVKLEKRNVSEDTEFLDMCSIIIKNLYLSQNENFKYPSYSQKELEGFAKTIYRNKDIKEVLQ